MHIEKRLRRWGNSYGVPLSKKEVESLHAAVGDRIVAEVERHPAGTDLHHVTAYRLGGRDVDEVLGDEAVAGR